MADLTDQQIASYVTGHLSDPTSIQNAMYQYGVTPQRLEQATGYGGADVDNYFSSAGLQTPTFKMDENNNPVGTNTAYGTYYGPSLTSGLESGDSPDLSRLPQSFIDSRYSDISDPTLGNLERIGGANNVLGAGSVKDGNYYYDGQNYGPVTTGLSGQYTDTYGRTPNVDPSAQFVPQDVADYIAQKYYAGSGDAITNALDKGWGVKLLSMIVGGAAASAAGAGAAGTEASFADFANTFNPITKIQNLGTTLSNAGTSVADWASTLGQNASTFDPSNVSDFTDFQDISDMPENVFDPSMAHADLVPPVSDGVDFLNANDAATGYNPLEHVTIDDNPLSNTVNQVDPNIGDLKFDGEGNLTKVDAGGTDYAGGNDYLSGTPLEGVKSFAEQVGLPPEGKTYDLANSGSENPYVPIEETPSWLGKLLNGVTGKVGAMSAVDKALLALSAVGVLAPHTAVDPSKSTTTTPTTPLRVDTTSRNPSTTTGSRSINAYGDDPYTYGQRPQFNYFSYHAKGGRPTPPPLAMQAKMSGANYESPMSRAAMQGFQEGPGGGQDDLIQARLSPKEYVMDASTMADLGDGNPDEGARKMDEFRKNVRAHKRSAATDSIPPKAKPLISYMPKRNRSGVK